MSLLPSLNRYTYLRCFCSVWIIVAATLVHGQSKSGMVIGDLKPLNGAIIKNLNSKMLAVSNPEGTFTLNLNGGDTLVTSSMGFKTDTLIFCEQNSLLITLKPLPNMLKEVVIKDYKIDPLEKLKKNQDDYKQIYRIGDDKNWFTPMIGPFSGIAINITALYNHFSRAGKNARKLQKTIVRDYYADIVDSRFTKTLVTKYTGYEGQQLENFMVNNRPEYEFIKYASDYDIIKYIQKMAKENPSPAIANQNTK